MEKTKKPSLYGLDLKEAEALMEKLEAPKYRAKQVLEWLYQKHASEYSDLKNIPTALKEKLANEYDVTALEMEAPKKSIDQESVKFLFKTIDGRFLESVLISQKGRRTVCVSTQLGCKMGCTFCASGKGSFGRNLTAGEVVEQVARIEKHLGERVSNVVFMGMGEPLDNFEVTMRAVKVLEKPWGFNLGARRITVSTSGITPKIVDFVDQFDGRIRLSISLHSSQEEKRNELVPINRKYSIKQLVKTLQEMSPKMSRKITFEYTLIKDQNDSKKEAEGVAKIAASLEAMVNIIPYNPIREMNYERPTIESIQNFKSILVRRGVRVVVRQTAGRDIDAACGQLRLDREERGA